MIAFTFLTSVPRTSAAMLQSEAREPPTILPALSDPGHLHAVLEVIARVADALSAAGLIVPELDAATRAEIDRHLPSYGNSQNPVDATAQAVRELGHYRLNAMVAASPEVDAIVSITSATDGPAVLRARRAWAAQPPTPLPTSLCKPVWDVCLTQTSRVMRV